MTTPRLRAELRIPKIGGQIGKFNYEALDFKVAIEVLPKVDRQGGPPGPDQIITLPEIPLGPLILVPVALILFAYLPLTAAGTLTGAGIALIGASLQSNDMPKAPPGRPIEVRGTIGRR